MNRILVFVKQMVSFFSGCGSKAVNVHKQRKEGRTDAMSHLPVIEEMQPQPISIEMTEQPYGDSPRQRAKRFLADNGIEKIQTHDDVNKIFWEMSIRRKPVSKRLANAVHIVICDNRLMKSFNRKLELYNEFMREKSTAPTFMDAEQKLKELIKAHKTETYSLIQARNSAEREKNAYKQRFEQDESMNRKLTKRFMNQLKGHQGRFQAAYDFTDEDYITEFLSWYKLLKRRVSKRTIGSIVRHRLSDDTANLFLRMVAEHNSQFEVEEEANA